MSFVEVVFQEPGLHRIFKPPGKLKLNLLGIELMQNHQSKQDTSYSKCRDPRPCRRGVLNQDSKFGFCKSIALIRCLPHASSRLRGGMLVCHLSTTCFKLKCLASMASTSLIRLLFLPFAILTSLPILLDASPRLSSASKICEKVQFI